VLRAIRPLGYVLPGRLLGGRRTWDAEFVPATAGTERDVEIPWAASAVAACFGLWLDVGYVHAEPRYWDAIVTPTWQRHLRYGYGLDLVPPQGQDALPVHVVGDVVTYDFRPLPRFDLITCISTLEHIGCDNTRYAPAASRDPAPPEQQERALRQLLAALTRRGRLLISVPYGAFEDHGWFLQYDAVMVHRLGTTARHAGRRLVSERYYRLRRDGWERAGPAELTACTYRSDEWRASSVALLEFAE